MMRPKSRQKPTPTCNKPSRRTAVRNNGDMADTAKQTTVISASPGRCFQVATEFERYPEWAKDVKEAVVLERDALGRGTKVEFRASALGRSTHYTLGYTYGDSPLTIAWRLVDGDIMRTLDGDYMFESVSNGTLVTYDLSIDLVIPLPGFVKRRAENRILHTLTELKSRCEA